MMKGARLRVAGRVQGVFFRNWTVEEAKALGIRGPVRNLSGGDVEFLAFGEEGPLRDFIARCHQGPRAAEVERVEVERVEVEEAEGDAPPGFTREQTG